MVGRKQVFSLLRWFLLACAICLVAGFFVARDSKPVRAQTPTPHSAAQLSDCTVAYTSPTVLTICPDCSPATPCNVSFINGGCWVMFSTGVMQQCAPHIWAITAPATLTLSPSAIGGEALIYVTSAGLLTVTDSLAGAACAGCIEIPTPLGIDGYPLPPTWPIGGAVPLYSWTATGYPLNSTTIWDPDGGRNWRAVLAGF